MISAKSSDISKKSSFAEKFQRAKSSKRT